MLLDLKKDLLYRIKYVWKILQISICLSIIQYHANVSTFNHLKRLRKSRVWHLKKISSIIVYLCYKKKLNDTIF